MQKTYEGITFTITTDKDVFGKTVYIATWRGYSVHDYTEEKALKLCYKLIEDSESNDDE